MTVENARGGFTPEQIQALDKPLDRRLVKSRPAGDRSGQVDYLEGHTVIAQLNRIFGYAGWGYSIDAHGVDEYTQGPEQGHYALFWAQVTLHVAGSLPRTELGRSEVRNTINSKTGEVRNNVRSVDARSTAMTGAVTDALKRAARTYGDQLGNSLYDRDGDVHMWMVNNPINVEERISRLRAEVSAACMQDKEGAAKLSKAVDDLTLDELEKALAWFKARAARVKKTA